MKKILFSFVVLCLLVSGIIIPYSNVVEIKAAPMATSPIVTLRQTSVVFRAVQGSYDYYDVYVKNTGNSPSKPFSYWFTINNSWNVYPDNPTQNNPINPGATIKFYCYVTHGTSVSSLEMSSNIYYIWPDDIWP